MTMVDLEGRTLLAVFAHPDDESLACGGLLAWCALMGARVAILCVTQGEAGPGAPDPDVLREARTQELQAAATVLGATDVIVLRHPDGMLPWVDPDVLEADIRDVIVRFQPDVVVTFGEDGLYWHPDHVTVHERTTAAVASLDGGAPALYYVSMPPAAMRALIEHARGVAGADTPLSIFGIENPDAFGDGALPPTLVLDAGSFAGQKLAAIKCHRTQLEGSALALVAEGDAARFLGVEHFRRASVGSQDEAFIERLAELF
jgi:LmbE family N-acetylglucosaminyl deacetylase